MIYQEPYEFNSAGFPCMGCLSFQVLFFYMGSILIVYHQTYGFKQQQWWFYMGYTVVGYNGNV